MSEKKQDQAKINKENEDLLEEPKAKAKVRKIPVVETFGPTIQGEGQVIGYQTHFIRFGGCDYRCERCDSLHAVLPHEIKRYATYMTMDELILKCREMQLKTFCNMFTFSGGNPCMWELQPLIADIHAHNGVVAVETQGTLWKDWLRSCQFVTVSPKGPGMGERFEHDKFEVFVTKLMGFDSDPSGVYAHPGFTVKVVVFDQRDIEMIVEILEKWPFLRPRMFISVGNTNPPEPARRDVDGPISKEQFIMQVLHSTKMIAEDVLADKRLTGVRVLPQMHTLLWGNDKGR